MGIFDRILILRSAHSIFHRQVLHRLHEQRDPIHLRELRLKPTMIVRLVALRSSRGFRLIWMRPLLGVILVP